MRYRLLSALVASASTVLAADPASYDYIVVGSGPGGGPLAADLARAGFSTLLIEAGGDEGDNPTYAELQYFNEAANDEATRWDFWVKHSDDPVRDLKFKHTTWDTGDGTFYVGLDPPAGAKLLGIQYPRAAVLGGCAMHNAGVCSLPQDDDWNIIVNKTGDTSWSADKMRKYLIKVEKNEYLAAGLPEHGYDGEYPPHFPPTNPLLTTPPPPGYLATSRGDASWIKDTTNPATKIFKKLAELTGLDPTKVEQYANGDILGKDEPADFTNAFYNMVQHGSATGKRASPNNYIRATLASPQKYPLTVKLQTLVTKVLFNTTGPVPRATGVEVMTGSSLYRADPKHQPGTKGPLSTLHATREVIIAGGAFNSPQLLKLSGIGPKAELAKFNIPLIKDLPGVGTNLGDNYEGSLLALANAPINSGLITLQFRTPTAPTKKRNIFTWCGQFSFEGFWPGFPTDYGPKQYECALVHMAPKSQAGTVTLRSADPQDVPEINFRFFESGGEADLKELVDAGNLLREAWQSAGDPALPFNELHPCPGPQGSTRGANCTDATQKEYYKTQAYSHHATSTCAIGADDDPLAVLDSKFRVRGVAGLRVVDASAFPVVPGAFPSLPTMMISAKAAEVILAEVGKGV